MVADHEKVSAMAEVPWLDAREQRAWRAFIDLTRELPAELNRQLTRDAGLSGADYALLVPLSEAADGRIRPRDLGRAVDWDRSRLSHQIRRMQERGLVVREECCTDGRGAFVVLTDRGRDAITSAAPDHVRSVRRFFFDVLQPAEVETLISIYDRVLEQVRKEGHNLCLEEDPGAGLRPSPSRSGQRDGVAGDHADRHERR
jgi:DNA-binding MarR family transcriptional regulator